MLETNDSLTRLILKSVFLLTMLSINFSIAKAQSDQANNDLSDLPERPRTCEGWLTTLTFAGREWEKNKDSLLIVIVRPGKKDSRRISLQRIKTLKEFFLKPSYKIKAVFAEGERVEEDADGFGLVEFYVEGKLFISALLEPKQDILIKSCKFL